MGKSSFVTWYSVSPCIVYDCLVKWCKGSPAPTFVSFSAVTYLVKWMLRFWTDFKSFRIDTVATPRNGDRSNVLRDLARQWVASILQSVLTDSQGRSAPCSMELGVLSPGHEADHSSQSSAKVKSMWICTCAPPLRVSRKHLFLLMLIFRSQGKTFLGFNSSHCNTLNIINTLNN